MTIEDILEKFVRKKNPVFLPVTLRQKEIYILPTGYGLLFIAVLFAMLMGSVNYNNNLGFLLTFLLGGMAFVSLLHTFRNLSGIRILSVNTAPAFAGDKAVFDFVIKTDHRARFSISFHFAGQADGVPASDTIPKRVSDLFRFAGGDESFCDLLPDTDNRVEVFAQTEKRGMSKPGALIVSSRYPLGLFRAWSRLPLTIETLVYPKPFPADFVFSGGTPSGDGEGASDGPGVEDFEGLKTYQPGDPLGHISWKTFSRGQGLFVKSFVGQSGSHLMMDWHFSKESDTERKLSMLCDMILKAHHLRMVYGLVLPGQRIEPSSGETHKHECLRALALM